MPKIVVARDSTRFSGVRSPSRRTAKTDGGKGEQDVGGPPDDRLDPGRERDEHAET
jgi:hypothetical protein